VVHAPEVVLDVVGRSGDASSWCPPEGWKALYAGYPKQTLTALTEALQHSTDVEMASILENVGKAGITQAGDILYGYTRHGQWTVRAGAMLGLDDLKDPRAMAALERNAKDLSKGPDLLSSLFDWLGASSHRVYQRELIRAVERNQVHAAEGVLESMVLDAWAGKADDTRAYAGEALAALNRPEALALTRKLLGDWSSTERSVGAAIAGYGRLTELRSDLQRMAEADSSQEVRQAAREALDRMSPSR
jgi:hypothetical protein